MAGVGGVDRGGIVVVAVVVVVVVVLDYVCCVAPIA